MRTNALANAHDHNIPGEWRLCPKKRTVHCFHIATVRLFQKLKMYTHIRRFGCWNDSFDLIPLSVAIQSSDSLTTQPMNGYTDFLALWMNSCAQMTRATARPLLHLFNVFVRNFMSLGKIDWICWRSDVRNDGHFFACCVYMQFNRFSCRIT